MKDITKKKISKTLKDYYGTEEGIKHRKKLASTMRLRMKDYGKFLQNKNIKINVNE